MKKRGKCILIALFLVLMLFGCGGLHHSQVDPEARNFHPRRMAVLPVDVGAYREAGGTVDQMIVEVLRDKKWFREVVGGESLNHQLQAKEAFQAAMTDYLVKFKAVNFSDPELSARIGDECGVDAFLVVSVEDWDYRVENEDKVAKVGLSIRMIQAPTGKILWKAGHSRTEKYLLLKPELSGVARTLFKEMIGYMPR